MIEQLVIRDARPGDESLILELITELADYERLAHHVVATPQDLTDNLFGADSHVRCQIAEWEQQPAGFALWFYNFSTFMGKKGLYLEDLFVRERFRGKGIGKALLQRLAVIAEASGCGRMEWVVLDWNQSAIDFYKSLGAATVEGWSITRLHGEPMSRLAEMKS